MRSELFRVNRTSIARGFTLIELLVVFTLLALLLSIAVPRYMQTVDNSKDRVRQQNIATLRDALDKFKADQGRYPAELPELVSKQYLRQIPLDPVTGSSAWVSVTHPAGLETGVYDVAPPLGMPNQNAELAPSQPADNPELQK